MNYLITESQLKLIVNEQSMGGIASPQMLSGSVHKDLSTWAKQHPNEANFLLDMALWAIPYVGPIIVGVKGSVEGVMLYQSGKKVEGIISLLTSPLALAKAAKVLKALGSSPEIVKMLQTINKTGVPLLVSKGQEAFMNWGFKTFGNDFVKFAKFIKDQKMVKPILDDIMKQVK